MKMKRKAGTLKPDTRKGKHVGYQKNLYANQRKSRYKRRGRKEKIRRGLQGNGICFISCRCRSGSSGCVVTTTSYFTVAHTAHRTALLMLGWLRHFFATPHELMLACSAILSLVQKSALEVEHSGLHLGICTLASAEQSRMFKETTMTVMMIVLVLMVVTG